MVESLAEIMAAEHAKAAFLFDLSSGLVVSRAGKASEETLAVIQANLRLAPSASSFKHSNTEILVKKMNEMALVLVK
jgi:hypothetical protein